MSDYIKREDALPDAMCVGIACQECSFLIHPVNGGCKLEEFIKALPAADVVERKKGKWIKSNIPNEKYVCSECGGACWYYDCKGKVAKSNFCPNCGADMREVDE